MKHAIIYSRVNKSPYMGHGSAASREPSATNLLWCESVAANLGATVEANFLDISDNDDPDRPELFCALQFCEENKVDYFVVYWLTDVRYPGFDPVAFAGSLARRGIELVCCQKS